LLEGKANCQEANVIRLLLLGDGLCACSLQQGTSKVEAFARLFQRIFRDFGMRTSDGELIRLKFSLQ
jgi:hypothetical protein